MNIEFGPTHWNHFCSSIQFHCAATKRDHGFGETKIFGLEVLEIPHHLGL